VCVFNIRVQLFVKTVLHISRIRTHYLISIQKTVKLINQEFLKDLTVHRLSLVLRRLVHYYFAKALNYLVVAA
jgi:NH3-dependent NAD+ synthetase